RCPIFLSPFFLYIRFVIQRIAVKNKVFFLDKESSKKKSPKRSPSEKHSFNHQSFLNTNNYHDRFDSYNLIKSARRCSKDPHFFIVSSTYHCKDAVKRKNSR